MRYIFTLSISLCTLLSTAQIAPVKSHLTREEAEKIINEKGIPSGDREGYLNFLMHGRQTFPDIKQMPLPSVPQMPANCFPNIGFENLDYSNWNGAVGTCMQAGNPLPLPTWMMAGINNNNGNPPVLNLPLNQAGTNIHHIIHTNPPVNNTTGQGYDSIGVSGGIYDLPQISPYGDSSCLRMGTTMAGGECERVSYQIAVNSQNTFISIDFAIVIQDGGHGPGEQAGFMYVLTDQNGAILPCCFTTYFVDATMAGTDTSFVTSDLSPFLLYRKWRSVFVDLSAYIGQTVNINVFNLDCAFGGHFCYGYVDFRCDSTLHSSNYVQGNPTAELRAPFGGYAYEWWGPNNPNQLIAGANTWKYTVTNPQPGDTYWVSLGAALGTSPKLSYTFPPASGLPGQGVSGKVRLLPNPASDHLVIAGLENSTQLVTIEVYNTEGKLVLKKEIYPADENEFKISSLEKGLYFVRLSDERNTQTFKLVKE